MWWRVVVLVVVLGAVGAAAAAVLAGSSEDEASQRAAAAEARASARRVPSSPALCRPVRDRLAGEVTAPQTSELSGLVASRRRPGVLWSLNDSGNPAQLFALRTDGTVLGTYTVPGAQNVDWEDIAAGPRGLYLADIGDNESSRPTIDVYRVPEPPVGVGAPAATAPAVRFTLRYAAGPRDAETLLVDPHSGAFVVVSKEFRTGGASRVYSAPRPVAGGTATLRLVRRADVESSGFATAGDISRRGDVVVVRTYTDVFVWPRRRGTSLAGTFRRRPCAVQTLTVDGQGEAIALFPSGRGFWTVPEGTPSPLRRYSVAPR